MDSQDEDDFHEPAVSQFGQHRDYMTQRKQKLARQAESKAAHSTSNHPQIFANVVFYITGYTQPSPQELKHMLIERGAQFLHYLSKIQVTHIIASGLTKAKEKEFRNYKVVRPEWVLDSISSGKMVSWHSYRVVGTNNTGLPAASTVDRYRGGNVGQAMEYSKQRPPLPPQITNDAGIEKYTYIVDRFGEGLNRPWVKKNLATNKDFIERYYANSRLHHLSMWKIEMKDYVAQLCQRYQKKPGSVADGGQGRVIMHVDFDSFFVAASLLAYPDLADQPVVVCHSQSPEMLASENPGRGGGTSQIASCNYVARSYGIKNGMFMAGACQLCPGLKTVPYQFEVYKRISRQFYEIVVEVADQTQAVSVDEALLDVSQAIQGDAYRGNAESLAQELRQRIFQTTRCKVSVGVGPNILLARVATTRAKPDGVFTLDADSFARMTGVGVRDLPGVGHVVEDMLKLHGINSLADLRSTSKERLCLICGEKSATTLYNFSQGRDERALEPDKPRQVFGAEIGWGIRFSVQGEADEFISRLATFVCRSMAATERLGGAVTLRIKKRQEGEGKPGKFLGHGICDSLSKSANLPRMTNDPKRIASACVRLLRQMRVDPMDIRAVGIQVHKLSDPAKPSMDVASMLSATNHTRVPELPSASQIDASVLKELPASIQQELQAAYQQREPAAELGIRSANGLVRNTSAPGRSTGGGKRARPRKTATLAFAFSNRKRLAGKPAKMDLRQAFDRVSSLDLIMPSQMDKQVWNELPKDIRRELARDYRRSNSNKIPEKDDDDDDEKTAPALLGECDRMKVRGVIKAWVASSEAGPYMADLEEFAQYVEALIGHRDLVRAEDALRIFKFYIRGKQSRSSWFDALETALERANARCQDLYGARLEI